MIKTAFPTDEIPDLTALSVWLSRQTDAVAVEFAEGRYYGELVLNSLKCPSLTLTAPDGAVITGGRDISRVFKRISPNILESYIGDGHTFERIKIDGRQGVLARYPKYREGERLNGCTTLADIEKVTGSFPSVEGAYLHSLHTHEWGSNDYIVSGRSGGRLSLSWVGNNNRGGGLKADCCYIENLPGLLTEENEWYYNKGSGILQIFDSSDCSEREMQVTVLDKICLLRITDCVNTEIKISGITFADTDRAMFKLPWLRYLRSDWAFNRGSAAELRGSKNVTVSGCTFRNIGSSCIGIFDYNENITVRDCDFEASLSNGVLILGNPDSTYCTSSWEGDRHITEIEKADRSGAASENYPRNILIDSCLFNGLGMEDKQSAGVCISLAHRVTVSRSTLCRLPRAGVNICENAFGGHTVRDCDIFDCVRETGDHGPFNSWGRDRFWSLGGYDTEGRRGELKKPYALLDMMEENRIFHNRVAGSRGFGIDLDDGSTNYIIENNFCFGVGIKLREGFFRTVRNNVIVNAPLDLHATYAGNDDIIENNVVLNSQPLSIALLRDGYTTKINNNYFINSAKKSRKQKILRGTQNIFENTDPKNILNNTFAFDGFVPFEYDFGRADAPKPVLEAAASREGTYEFVNIYGAFSFMDERLRSAAGAPGLDGVYVKALFPFTGLKKRGIQKNDVILTLNNKPFGGSRQEFTELVNGGEAGVIRSQRLMDI